VAIQRADARVANKRPKASTLNCKATPGKRWRRVHSTTCPLRMGGIRVTTIQNLVTDARRVQNSLRFLLFSPVKRMSIAATAETRRAKRGLRE